MEMIFLCSVARGRTEKNDIRSLPACHLFSLSLFLTKRLTIKTPSTATRAKIIKIYFKIYFSFDS